MSANKGSLLYLISEDLKTSTQSVLNAIATSVKSLNETVEAGVNPEKSLKRKFQEYQEQQRAENQRKEEERLQKEQEEQERRQLVTMIHPYTGQQMQLTGEQREQFIRDLATMKPTDFECWSTIFSCVGFPTWTTNGNGIWNYGNTFYTFDSQSSRTCSTLCCSGYIACDFQANFILKVK